MRKSNRKCPSCNEYLKCKTPKTVNKVMYICGSCRIAFFNEELKAIKKEIELRNKFDETLSQWKNSTLWYFRESSCVTIDINDLPKYSEVSRFDICESIYKWLEKRREIEKFINIFWEHRNE